jgi:putative hemin transport protein
MNVDFETNVNLKTRWEALKAENHGLRIRNAAQELGVTEMELLATQIGETVTPLKADFESLLKRFEEIGYAMSLTRNASIVHERKGVFSNFSWSPYAALFVGEDIDIRFFPTVWKYAFTVVEGNDEKPRKSIQIFDKYGDAVYKLYIENKSNVEAFEQIIADFEDTPNFKIELENAPELAKVRPIENIDVNREAFQEEWINLKDTHDFFGMVKRHNLHRIEALNLAPTAHYASKVDNGSLRKALNLASESGQEIMVFVGNRGAIGIHTGPVKKIVDYGPWLNVLDPEFNLHIFEADIKESWVVRKPTEDGEVTSLECFDANGELIITLFGKRKPGIPELESWRKLVEQL